MSASLFDFGLVAFHNARELLDRGSGPYFYLPKLESHLEARLWAQAFALAEDELGLPRGSIRCTVLIETILAAFEMEEILYELRDYGCALNAGRWDYIFSCIKKFRTRDWVLPDRVQVTMAVPFMRAYTELLVRTCHRRGAHAIGGMAAFIPSRRDPEVNEVALAKVREDKERESRDGFDGTWVAHPDLVPVATEIFDGVLGSVRTSSTACARTSFPTRPRCSRSPTRPGEITEQGLRTNVSVGVRYLDAWLHGVGAAAIDNLMEDAATAEISRSQVWQWVRTGRFDAEHVRREAAEVERGRRRRSSSSTSRSQPELVEFLTLPGVHFSGVSLDSTKADDIALVIEEAIVSGELAPGTVLRQEQLSEQFNVSRTPIREALRRLAALGLVSFVPNRGVRVRTISREELHEAFMVRAELESLATEVAADEDHAGGSRRARRDRAAVRRDLAALRAREPGEERRSIMGDWVRANHAFHDVIYRVAGPAARRAAREERAPHLLRARTVGAGRPLDRRALPEERRAAPGDQAGPHGGSPTGARALAREHVLSSFELLETILEQVGAQPRDWQRGRAARR